MIWAEGQSDLVSLYSFDYLIFIISESGFGYFVCGLEMVFCVFGVPAPSLIYIFPFFGFVLFLFVLVSQDEINHISQFTKHEIDLSTISNISDASSSTVFPTSNEQESKKLRKGLVVERGDLNLIVELIMKDN